MYWYFFFILGGNFSIFDDGSFHTEPSPHHIRLYTYDIRNIKGNKFFRLFNAWVSSVHWDEGCLFFPGQESDVPGGQNIDSWQQWKVPSPVPAE